ncbi:GNAT family N-acetyltransferase [Thiolinea disciformis]|uniref:GNAT family N-acetyltransferase n=1 Tax=Thiolinea disciformis TaxID=125614 RepID=UPI0003754A0F|nr:GNAT family N-acetyltransferase [Thiolinea disciformis]
MRIIPFNHELMREGFDCGEPLLNHYLQQLAGQHTRKNVSRTFVAVKEERIAGFYSLSMAEAQLEELPNATRKKLPPHYPVPVARLSRLAVDQTLQGQRIGEALLVNALTRCARIASDIGVVGVVVDAKHDKAKQFYEKYGFGPYTSKPLTLFIPMQTIIQSLPN